MDRKIIFFDIDGTLISEDTHYLPSSTVDSIRRTRANGHLTFINTGRTYFFLDPILKEIGFDGYVCGCGTRIYLDEKPVFTHTLSHQTCLEIVKLLRDCQVSALFEANERVFFDTKTPSNPIIRSLKAKFGDTAVNVDLLFQDPSMHFDKFVVWLNASSDVKTFRRFIDKEFDYIDRGGNFGEIVPKGCSKATGIQFLLDYYGLPLADSYAIGDSTNDLPMLSYVPNSIAMGNSMAEILPYCSYQTANLEDDGIEKALRHFGFI